MLVVVGCHRTGRHVIGHVCVSVGNKRGGSLGEGIERWMEDEKERERKKERERVKGTLGSTRKVFEGCRWRVE